MSNPPTPPSGDAPLPSLPKPQMQPMQMGGVPAKSGKGKLIGIIAGLLIIVGGLVFAGITYGPDLWAKYMGGGGDLNKSDGTIKYVLDGVANNKPEVLWEALPASHQQTLNDELKKSMANVDSEVHKQVFAVLQKLTGLLKNKKALILESGNGFFEQHSGSATALAMPQITENWDGAVNLLEIVVNSKFSDTTWVENPDLGVLLKEDGGKLMSSPDLEKLINLALAEDDDPDAPEDMAQAREWIKGIEVTVDSSTETTAKVKLSSTDFIKTPKGEVELDMVKVEDRWLPKEVAMGIDQFIAQLKLVTPMGSLADTPMTAQQKAVTLNFLKSVDGVLDAIDKQETAENLMQAAIGGFGGLALQLEQLQNAFPNMGVAGGNPGAFPGGVGPSPTTGLPVPGVGLPSSGGIPGGLPPGSNPGLGGGTAKTAPALPGLPPPSTLPPGRLITWNINGGKRNKIDQIYLNKSEATIQTAFGAPDQKDGIYWIYKNMTVRNIGDGGTMTKVHFGIQNGIVVDIRASP